MMEFEGFKVLPAEGRMVDATEQRAIGTTLEAERVLECIPGGKSVLVEVGRKVGSSVSPAAAHGVWNPSYFPNVETPVGLPRQPLHALTPAGLVHVTISAIERNCPGMGSHFGFEGYFLSVLMSPTDRQIWDARGQRAE